MKTIKEQLREFLEISPVSARKLAGVAAELSGTTTQSVAMSISWLQTNKRQDIMSTLADALRLAMRELDNETAEKVLGK